MKKIMGMFFVALVIILGSVNNYAAAADHYIGTNSNGQDVYVMTETIKVSQLYTRNGTPEGTEYDLDAKAVYPGESKFGKIHYIVYWTQLAGVNKNGRMLTRHELYGDPNYAVERELLNFIHDNYVVNK